MKIGDLFRMIESGDNASPKMASEIYKHHAKKLKELSKVPVDDRLYDHGVAVRHSTAMMNKYKAGHDRYHGISCPTY